MPASKSRSPSDFAWTTWVALFAALATIITLATPAGRMIAIDEAIYVRWGADNLAVPADWMGMKPLTLGMIRELVQLLGPGISTVIAVKLFFGVWGVAFAVAVYRWMRAEGESAPESTLLVIASFTFPVVTYASGRALSEIVMLAFLAAGVAALRSIPLRPPSIGDAMGRGALCLAFLTAAYFARTTSIVSSGALLFFDLVSRLLALRGERSSEEPTRWIFAVWPPVAVGAALLLIVVLLALRTDVPVFPLGQARAHIASWQVDPDQYALTAMTIAGVLGPVVLSVLLVLGWGRSHRRETITAVMWLAAALAPYGYVIARGGYINPRQASDLALPSMFCLLVAFRLLRSIGRAEGQSRGRAAGLIAAVGVLALALTLPTLAANRHLVWFSHGFKYLPPLSYWMVGVLVALTLLVAAAVQRDWFRRPLAQVMAGVLLLGIQLYLASDAAGYGRTLVAPTTVRALLKTSGAQEGDVVATVLPDYEARILQFSLPELRWRAHGSSPERPTITPYHEQAPAEWILVSKRAEYDAPGAADFLRLEAAGGGSAKPVAEDRVWRLLRIQVSPEP